MPAPKGHPKWGGNVKGSKHKATIEREQGLDALRQLVLQQLGPMTQAQVEHAQGVHYMMLREPDGGYTKLSDDPEISDKQIKAALAAGGQAFKIFKQAPNTAAYSTLTDRTFGKATETVDVNVTGDTLIRQRMTRGRERNAKR